MKQRIFTRLLCLVLVLVCALPALAWAEDTSRSYDFDLSVGGQQEVRAAAGETVTVKTTGPIDGRSSFTGELLGFEDGCVIVAADGADTFRIPYDNIKKARVKGTIDFSA